MIISSFSDGTPFVLANSDDQGLANYLKSVVDESIDFSNNAKFKPDSRVVLNCSESEFIKDFLGTYTYTECIMIYRSIRNSVGVVIGSSYTSDGTVVTVEYTDINQFYPIREKYLKGDK